MPIVACSKQKIPKKQKVLTKKSKHELQNSNNNID